MGVPFLLLNGFSGSGEFEVLKDKDGEFMETGRFWDPDAREHTDGETPAEGPSGRAYSALPVDWDNDGDFDLVVGNDKGGLFLRENLGDSKQFAFSPECVALKAGDEPAVLPGGYAMPISIDWDGDGRWDLISGAGDGAVYWFRNSGEPGNPELGVPRQLVKSAEAEGLGRGVSAQVEVCDWDGDGDLDLLVGDKDLKLVDGKLDAHGYVWLYRGEGGASK